MKRLSIAAWAALAIAGCKEKPGDEPAAGESPASAAETTAAETGRDAGDRAAPVDLGLASERATAGATECYDLETCKLQCDAQTRGACDRLAEHVQHGWGVEADPDRADEIRKNACTHHADPAACFHRLDDEGFPLAELEKKCQGGDGFACHVLARQSGLRSPDEPEFELAEASYDNDACEAGYALGCKILMAARGSAYRRYRQDPEAIERRYTKLRERDCDAGVAFACAALERHDRAAELWRRQCESGYPPSCKRFLELVDEDHIEAPDDQIARIQALVKEKP